MIRLATKYLILAAMIVVPIYVIARTTAHDQSAPATNATGAAMAPEVAYA